MNAHALNKFAIILPRPIYKTRQTNVIVDKNMIYTQLVSARA